MQFLKTQRQRLSRKFSQKMHRPRGLKPSFELLGQRVLLSTYTVTNTDGSGPGSFLEAVNDANSAGGGVIDFNISGNPNASYNGKPIYYIPGPESEYVIDPSASGITIDGSSQPGYTATSPLIEIHSLADEAGNSSNLTVKGLYISNLLLFGTNYTVQGCTLDFLSLNQVTNSIIGGPNPGQGNIFTGSSPYAESLELYGASDNIIQGNIFEPMTNYYNDISIINSNNNIIGGTTAAERNILSGASQSSDPYTAYSDEKTAFADSEAYDGYYAALYIGYSSSGNFVEGNYIGTDATGTTASPTGFGIVIAWSSGNIIGGSASGAGNLISGYTYGGIIIYGGDDSTSYNPSQNNTIQGNLIGTNADGDTALLGENDALASGANGVFLFTFSGSNTLDISGTEIGGTQTGAGNTISGNTGNGIVLDACSENSIEGNLIGANSTGENVLPNGGSGIEISDGSSNNTIGGTAPGAGNTISGNANDGVLITDSGTSGNTVAGNIIGMDGGQNVTPPAADVRRVIVPNQAIVPAVGVVINKGGRNPVPNGANGIEILGGATKNAISVNIFSGNKNDGVWIHGVGTTDNTISKNTIGLNVLGKSVPNGANGVEISQGASSNTIGVGEDSDTGNVISGNTNDGVSIHDAGTMDNTVTGNFIGTDLSGTTAVGNEANGVEIYGGASSNKIGATETGKNQAGENNVISGNVVDGVAIHDVNTSSNTVENDRIGTDVSGSFALANIMGVTISGGASLNTVGGSEDGAGDLISGNAVAGVQISGTNASGNSIEGSFIGTDASGTVALPNTRNGVWLSNGASANTVGGSETGASDLISGNGASGVLLSDAGTINNNIEGNRIGTDVTGMIALANNGNGVQIDSSAAGNTVGGSEAGAGNLVSGNAQNGVMITDVGSITNKIEGNYIGTTALGTVALGNGGDGVLLQNGTSYNTIGGTEAGAGNVISGNITGLAGVVLTGVSTSENKLEGNYIGADATGSNPLPNTIGVVVNLGASNNTIGGTETGAENTISFNGNGVVISNTPTVGNNVEGNLISGNTTYGVKIAAASSGNTIGGSQPQARNLITKNGIAGVIVSDVGTVGNHVEGNTIQSNVGDGVEVVQGASSNAVGGSETGAGNIISGNTGNGVVISGPLVAGIGTNANSVEGNLIGTTFLGTSALPNGGDGVLIEYQAFNNTIGGTETGAGNVISGNTLDGIAITGAGTTGNVIEANYVGTDYTGQLALGNQGYGISLTYGAANNTIGGTDSTARNIISANASGGVLLSNGGTSTNVVEGNFIGTDVTGEFALGNSYCGVYVSWGASGNTIGGTASGTGNVISANSLDGIDLINSGTSGNVVQGNLIGTDKAGTKALGNKNAGIGVINGASGNTIGGTATGAGNTLSGNINDGINIYGSGASGNLVQGNLIGTDPTGTIALGNGVHGVLIYSGATNNTVGGTSASARNVISANGSIAVSIHDAGTSGNIIEGNDIGTDITGANALGNKSDGVLIAAATNNVIGGTAAGAGNVISANTADGVHIYGTGTSGNLVEGNFIGTDATGTKALGNQSHGIAIVASATNNTIGGTVAGAANVISANTGNGVFISDSGTSANLVQGNDIGTDITGTHALGNQGDGVLITSSATNNTIGGTSSQALNVISGNAVNGVLISGSGTSTNLIEGNVIGTDVTGTKALANQSNGVSITSAATNNTVGGSTSAARNIISGNTANGVLITDTGTNSNTVEGNFIGTDVTGSLALGNQSAGITITSAAKNNLIGGTASGTANVLSANVVNGVVISGSGTSTNVVEGNLIGTDATGEQALGNGYCGVYISSGATANTIGGTASGTGNVISANSLDGVDLINGGTSGNIVEGNLVGTDKADTKALGNHNSGVAALNGASGNTIGGTTAGAANLISGNTGNGVNIYGSGTTNNLVEGNLIGTDLSGTHAMGNGSHGVLIYGAASNNIIGGTTSSARNVISGNNAIAVSIHDAGTSGNVVEGNYIGTDVTGTTAIANHGNGIIVVSSATNNVIGGTAAGAGNVIAYNQGIGVLVGSSPTDPSTGNSILGNSIYGNTGLGISLGNAGVTVNSPGSPHTGPNDLLNLPVITSATRNSGSTTIQGTLNSTPNMAFRIELFSNPAADPSGYGQGQTFLGFINVTTDASGNATFSVTFSTSLASGQVITATATDANGNTSEFSQDYTLA